MIYIDERTARIAGQVAAADAICEYADRLAARDVAGLMARMDRVQRTRRNAKAVH
jgi:hypothetical protein